MMLSQTRYGSLLRLVILTVAIAALPNGTPRAADDLGTGYLLVEARSLATLIRRIGERDVQATPIHKVTLPHRRFRVPYMNSITLASRRYAIPEPLIAAVIKCESNWNPRAHSRANARGLMQVLPRTARGTFGVSPRHLWDPATNIELGTAYLRRLADRYQGNALRVVAAYNAGPTRIDRNTRPPRETRRYIRCIRQWHAVYEQFLR